MYGIGIERKGGISASLLLLQYSFATLWCIFSCFCIMKCCFTMSYSTLSENHKSAFTQQKREGMGRQEKEKMWDSKCRKRRKNEGYHITEGKIKMKKCLRWNRKKRRERKREGNGCGAEMPSCEQEPSVKLGRMKEKKVIVASHWALLTVCSDTLALR